MTYYYDPTPASVVAGGLIIVFVILAIICLPIVIIGLVGLWKMFKKAGEEGWKAIIPVYNAVTLTKIVGVSPWWILVVFVTSLIADKVPFLSIFSLAASIYFGVILSVSIAKSFGKEEGFAVGLFLLAPIFYLVLGVGSAEYKGKIPMKDPVMDFVNEKIFHKEPASANTTTTASAASSASKFCTNCGAKIDGDSSFCTSCGTKSE